MDFAVIKTGGKQYIVKPGTKLKIEKIESKGDAVVFGDVLLRVSGKKIELGTPKIDKAQVEAKLVRSGRESKKIVFKYSSKARYHKKKGHRQPFTEVEITKI